MTRFDRLLIFSTAHGGTISVTLDTEHQQQLQYCQRVLKSCDSTFIADGQLEYLEQKVLYGHLYTRNNEILEMAEVRTAVLEGLGQYVQFCQFLELAQRDIGSQDVQRWASQHGSAIARMVRDVIRKRMKQVRNEPMRFMNLGVAANAEIAFFKAAFAPSEGFARVLTAA
ncbi:hypothetical protein [Ferrimonas marina]|uniref:Uncharacterized protein n=1 Tax=Ferrimonas marina TaxID=299255 RepID=A0A1M5UED0_9GAMM|nr:hypothetical protein [Ferrimonas marina]SHH61319.1 hypothetical protein SAMN02745129_2527 [Ferrimonas marina]